jgi:nitrate/nitrite transport system substrate-binding protein
MRRWGQIPEGKPDAWYAEIAKQVYRPDVFIEAAKALVAEKKANAADFDFASDGFRAPTKDFIDGVEYDGRKPNVYIEKLTLGLKGQQKIENGNVVAGK